MGHVNPHRDQTVVDEKQTVGIAEAVRDATTELGRDDEITRLGETGQVGWDEQARIV